MTTATSKYCGINAGLCLNGTVDDPRPHIWLNAGEDLDAHSADSVMDVRAWLTSIIVRLQAAVNDPVAITNLVANLDATRLRGVLDSSISPVRTDAQVTAAKARQDLEKTVESGKWLVAMFRVEGDEVHMERHVSQFRGHHHEAAMDLLTDDLAKLRELCTCGDCNTQAAAIQG